jgi:FlaA1/EpsC-like NDP-sugar epimerase
VIAAIHPRLAVVLHDLGMVWLAWVAANWLRYSIEPNPTPLAWFMPETGLAVLAQGLVLWWTGWYRGCALREPAGLVECAPARSVVAIAVALFLYSRLDSVRAPCSSSIRSCFSSSLAPRPGFLLERQPAWLNEHFNVRRVLVLGAGRAGEALIRELARENRYRPVGLLRRQRRAARAKVHGVRCWAR